MAWRIEGQLIETCSCNMFCPCWFGVPDLMEMDRGYCATAIAFRVREGRSNNVDLAGRTTTIAVHFPGPTLFDGNATARLYIDDGASADQQREFEAIFTGKQGGPMGILSGLVSKWLPTQSAAIDVKEDGDTISVAVGNAGEITSTRLVDGEGHGFTLQGGGFVAAFGMQAAEMAPSKGTRWSDPDLFQPFETKSGARGSFTWSG